MFVIWPTGDTVKVIINGHEVTYCTRRGWSL